jgi:hypothetical protein
MTSTSSSNYTTSFAIEPDVPHDPLAAAESAAWAVARHQAVLGLPLDDRGLGVLAALEQLAAWLAQPRSAVSPRHSRTEEMPLAAIEVMDDGVDDQAQDGLGSDELPSDVSEAIELSPDEVSDAENAEHAEPETAVLSATPAPTAPVQFSSAETIVLSGPEIKRKIRHKQSIMPSYVGQLLYEDIGALFEIGDREGALISLERLLAVAPISPQIDAFLSHNEQRLVEYYETVLGPWSRIGRLREGETAMPPGYFRLDKVALLLPYLDGTRTLDDAMAHSGLRRIEACAVLSQLARSSSLDLGDRT